MRVPGLHVGVYPTFAYIPVHRGGGRGVYVFAYISIPLFTLSYMMLQLNTFAYSVYNYTTFTYSVL